MGEENEAKATVAEVDDTKKAKKPKADRLEKRIVRPAHKSYMQNRELPPVHRPSAQGRGRTDESPALHHPQPP